MIPLDGASLTVGQIVAVADGEPAGLTAAAREAVVASHRYALAATGPVYGRTTGVGANRDVDIADPGAHARALIRSHASSAGPPRARRRVRAMLAVRLNQLAAGGSGVSPAVADALAGALAGDALPEVREYGSVGTGDLAALAAVAVALPVEPTADDALPLLSSHAATLADSALACAALSGLAEAALAVAALTVRAVDGNLEAFAPAVQRASPFDGAAQVCRRIRSLAPDTVAARLQDPFALRTLPQVHGALLDALAGLDDAVRRMANAPAENPLLLPGTPVTHHGAFLAASLGVALDGARQALAQSARLGCARLGLLLDPQYTGLPPFLGDGTAGASGLMLTEYVAASALAELRALAAVPAGMHLGTLSRGVEDATCVSLAARQALQAAEAYRTVLACELLAAVRALRMRSRPVPTSYAQLPDEPADRDLTGDLQLAERIV